MQRIAPFCYYYQELSGLHALELAVVELGVEAAKANVPNPEEYDFHKILNWK